MKSVENQTCFFCDHYYHAGPDTDRCDLSGEEVYFDTPKCPMFGRASVSKRPALGLIHDGRAEAEVNITEGGEHDAS